MEDGSSPRTLGAFMGIEIERDTLTNTSDIKLNTKLSCVVPLSEPIFYQSDWTYLTNLIIDNYKTVKKKIRQIHWPTNYNLTKPHLLPMHQAGHHWPWTPFSDWSSLFLQVALLFCGQTSPYYLSLHCCQPEVHAPIWIYASETCAMCANWNRNINYQRQLRHENWSGVKKVRWIRQQKNPIQSTYIYIYIYIYMYIYIYQYHI